MDPDGDVQQKQLQTSAHQSASESETHVKQAGSSLSATHNGVDNGLISAEEKDGANPTTSSEVDSHHEEDEDCGKLQPNGDLFSPDDTSEVVTVICKTDFKKSEEGGGQDRGEKDNADDYDTHSDSIETLEEDDDSQEQLSDSFLRQIRLTGKSAESEESEEVFGDKRPTDAAAQSRLSNGGEEAEDNVSTDSHEVIPDVTSTVPRPESLSLPRPLQYYERNRSTSEPQHASKQTQAIRDEASGGHQRTRSEAIDIQGVKVRGDLSYGDDVMSKSLPHGTLLRKGDMVEFVADNLNEKIKKSSPMSRADSSSMGSRRSSQRSIASTSSATSTSVATSSGMSRSPSSLLTQSPDTAPPIDPCAVMELEVSARRVADSVDLMMGNLRNNLHKMSAITVGCTEAYKTSVDITCESVDSSIKSMYALMAKCEELNTTMEPVKQIGAQIKEIRRLLDRFEGQLADKP